MSFVAVAVGGSALTGLGGAYLQSSAARDAAKQQSDAARYAADMQYKMYEEQRADQQPWRQAGAQALTQMNDPFFQQNFSMKDFQEDPGYQFRMDQGLKALQASAAARGGLMSGNTLKGITDYSQDYASNEYQNAYNRFTNNQSQRFNRLASLAGLGQTANGQVGAAGSNFANQAGAALMGGANAGAAATIGSAGAYSGALSGIGNNFMQYAMMNKYMPTTMQSQAVNASIGAMPSADNFSYKSSNFGPLE